MNFHMTSVLITLCKKNQMVRFLFMYFINSSKTKNTYYTVSNGRVISE
jgi:hypothetical protein